MANTRYNVEQAINRGNIIISHHPGYSMEQRGYGLDAPYYDCSSFIGSCWGISSIPATPSMVSVYTAAGFDHYRFSSVEGNLQRGDILIYNGPGGGAGADGHTTMYIGNGQVMQARGTASGVGIFTYSRYVHEGVWQDVLRGTGGIFIKSWNCTSHPDESFGV